VQAVEIERVHIRVLAGDASAVETRVCAYRPGEPEAVEEQRDYAPGVRVDLGAGIEFRVDDERPAPGTVGKHRVFKSTGFNAASVSQVIIEASGETAVDMLFDSGGGGPIGFRDLELRGVKSMSIGGARNVGVGKLRVTRGGPAILSSMGGFWAYQPIDSTTRVAYPCGTYIVTESGVVPFAPDAYTRCIGNSSTGEPTVEGRDGPLMLREVLRAEYNLEDGGEFDRSDGINSKFELWVVHAIDNISVGGADRASRARLYDKNSAKSALKRLSDQVIPPNPDMPDHRLRQDFEMFVVNTIDRADVFRDGGRERIGIDPILEVVRRLETLRRKLQAYKSRTEREQLGYESFVGRLSWDPASNEVSDASLYAFEAGRGLVPTQYRMDSVVDQERLKTSLRQAVDGTIRAIEYGLANPQPPATARTPQQIAAWSQRIKKDPTPVMEGIKAGINKQLEELLSSGNFSTALQLQFGGTGG
jgi:hypothetical protein